MFNFDILTHRSDSDSAKWQRYSGRDIIPMWVADMDFISPPAVMEALHQRVSHGIFGYGVAGQDLVDTVLAYLHDTYQWSVKPQWIVWLPGLVTGLNVACRSVGSSGQKVLTTVPVYPPFLTAPKNSDRSLITSPMIYSNQRWGLDFEHFKRVIDDQTVLFLLCNPHNPTGRVFSHQELTQVAQICMDHKLIICSDEIHCDLVLEPQCRHLPIASLSPEIAQHTITLMAPSKTYNIPGLSCSYAIIPNDRIRRRFTSAMAGIVPHVNILGMTAAQAAYRHGKPWLDQLIAYLRHNREITSRAISNMPKLNMGIVEATYLAWIDARHLDTDNPVHFFEKAGVGLSDGTEFDGPGFVRLNFGCPRKRLEKALNRMTSALTY